MDIYQAASSKADEIETELKRLGRWMDSSLPREVFEDMGAFGSNTMSFEQWLQFVLIPRIREIVHKRGEFPAGSNLAPHAVRYFDGDYDADSLREILYNLDKLINDLYESTTTHAPTTNSDPPTVRLGDTTIPDVLYSVAEVLPQFELSSLESQLQTFDAFLNFLSPTVRPAISAMLMKAAIRTTDPDCKKRIEQAAQDVAAGKRAAPPYNHTEAMKKYQEEHRKNYPPENQE